MTKITDDQLQNVVEAAMNGTTAKAKPKAKEPAEIVPEFDDPKKEKKLKGKKYSDLFGWDKSLDGKEDFIVETFNDNERVPEIDPHRVIDHEVMYPFVLSQQPDMKMKTMLVGPTGSGKTTCVEHYCAVVSKNLYRINGRQDMESDTLIGRPWVRGGDEGMDYILGEFPKALLAGDTILMDEPTKIPSGIQMTLQRVMERDGVLQIDDMPSDLEAKTIVPHHNARIVLADNVVGTGDNSEQYGATMIQDSSFLNRIDAVLYVPYLKPEQEEEILASRYPILVPKNSKGERGMQNVQRMVRMLNLLRQGFDTNELSSPASLRNVFRWAEMASKVRNYEEAFKWVLLNRYADDAERASVVSHYYTVFGKAL